MDTELSIEVNISANPPASYLLKATTTNPSQGGCAQAQPLPDVPPITIGETGVNTRFHWPAGLGRGQYWLCAVPASGNGPVASSPPQSPPFTVLTDAAPTVTITPPAGGAVAGGPLTVTLANWRTSDDPNAAISAQIIAQGGAPDSARRILPYANITQSDAATGAYTLQLTLPDALQPGRYALIIQGECETSSYCAVNERSAFFGVAAAAVTPTPTPTATTPPSATGTAGTSTGANGTGTTGSDAGFPWTIFAAVIWGVALALLVATILLIRKRRQRSRPPVRAAAERYREPPARPWR